MPSFVRSNVDLRSCFLAPALEFMAWKYEELASIHSGGNSKLIVLSKALPLFTNTWRKGMMSDDMLVEEVESGEASPEQVSHVAGQMDSGKVDIAEMRLERIHAFLVQSLEKVDPFQSNLGAISSDLALMAFRLKEGIDDAMNKSPNPLEDLQRLMPALEAYLRIARQFDRLGQLTRSIDAPHERRTSR